MKPVSNRIHLIEGVPGSGKTTLATQFLLKDVRQGESGLYVTFSEREEELRATAGSHDWPRVAARSSDSLPGCVNS